jgi:hypothetical protein
VSTINGRVLGFGEPLRVKSGERVLLHILNSSPTAGTDHWIIKAILGRHFDWKKPSRWWTDPSVSFQATVRWEFVS